MLQKFSCKGLDRTDYEESWELVERHLAPNDMHKRATKQRPGKPRDQHQLFLCSPDIGRDQRPPGPCLADGFYLPHPILCLV